MEFFARKYSFWAGLAGGCFLTMASHGTDQLMVQRLLSARDRAPKPRRAARQLGGDLLPIQAVPAHRHAALRLLRRRHLAPPAATRPHVPAIRLAHLPVGVAGLAIAAILAAAMANLSAALNALASTTVVDFIRPCARNLSEARIPATGARSRPSSGARAGSPSGSAPPMGLGARSRTLDRLHDRRCAAGRVSARRADPQGGRVGGDGGRGCGAGSDTLRDASHADRLDLVGADRDRGHILGRLSHPGSSRKGRDAEL